MEEDYTPYTRYHHNDPREKDPWFYCVVQDSFQNTELYGPHSENCRLYMSQRCAENWDDICEKASCQTKTAVPDNTSVIPLYQPSMIQQDAKFNEGQLLIYKTGMEKFCKVRTDVSKGLCVDMKREFNPLAGGTPIIHWSYGPGCAIDCSSTDISPTDPLIDKLLKTEKLNEPILSEMCLNKVAKQHAGLLDYCGRKGIIPVELRPVPDGKEGYVMSDVTPYGSLKEGIVVSPVTSSNRMMKSSISSGNKVMIAGMGVAILLVVLLILSRKKRY